ncbi:nitroreductase family protein [Myceligenerans pegani]|uniref:Nitroreductase family protein n=1 Tax=Myceligenerans pegani TaxID=2776917 RepID=A0ABR9MWI7_9MICO|nr:nitroreductase family protein [Myceligenerans sp. TRM 65318]MBE1875137.1 nitroreductase family protein [Myceligenerans sp. TRM 65318]MBE3017408.1 nitroreductase family protein [Myceligenerans sp. TRM 65318]
MEFQEVVRRRRMHRRFTGEPVAAEAVDRMLRNAVRAPSAGFSQGWAFVVVQEPADRDRFWSAATPSGGPTASGGTRSGRDMSEWLAGMRTAPVVVLVLTSKDAYLRRYAEKDKGWEDLDESRWPVPFWHVDAGMASLLILQTAVDEGLGACFFGVPPGEVPAVHAALEIPGEYEITGAIAVGHPAEGGAAGSPTRRRRKPLEDLVHRGRFTHQSG